MPVAPGRAMCGNGAMLSRFAIYFDEVARRGSIRRASEHLNVAPSAIDRQILKMEDLLQVPLFNRHPHGVRLSAAGEVLIPMIRRWRRELRAAQAQIDELRGLRRGEVALALAEGSTEFVTGALAAFRLDYPGIVFRLHIAGSQSIVDLVLSGEVDIGVTYNPPERQDLRIERALIYQIGAVMPPDHPLAAFEEVSLDQCVGYPLVGPDEAHSLRGVVDAAWRANMGGAIPLAAAANSVELIKELVIGGIGITLLAQIDVAREIKQGTLVYRPLTGSRIPLSVLSVVSSSGRQLSPPAALLIRHLADHDL